MISIPPPILYKAPTTTLFTVSTSMADALLEAAAPAASRHDYHHPPIDLILQHTSHILIDSPIYTHNNL